MVWREDRLRCRLERRPLEPTPRSCTPRAASGGSGDIRIHTRTNMNERAQQHQLHVSHMSPPAFASPPLIGIHHVHAALMQRVTQAIDSAQESNAQSQVIVLYGAAGSGKTHLLYQVSSLFHSRGFQCECGIASSERMLHGSIMLEPWKSIRHQAKYKHFHDVKGMMKAVHDYWTSLSRHQPVLLTFDNVTDYSMIRRYLPQRGVVIIIASRIPWPTDQPLPTGWTQISMPSLSLSDGALLLQSQLPSDEAREEAEEVQHSWPASYSASRWPCNWQRAT